MNVKEIFFTKREIKNGGVFLHLSNNKKEKIGIVLVNMSEDFMYPLDKDPPILECVLDDGTLLPPDEKTIQYHLDKVYKIASEQYLGEEITIYLIRVRGYPNIIGFTAYPGELKK